MKPQLWLLVFIFVFYASTLRNGHRWGDDYALYIHHAKNIATGFSYSSIGYLYDPYYPSYSVPAAAPVFPLLLAPVYGMFGMNFTALKMEEVVFFVAALAVLLSLFQNYLPPRYGLLLVAVMGLNPFLWNIKDDILSDIPFFFFVLLTALLVERRKSPLLCGAVAYLAIGTRMVGLVLLPTILLYEIFRNKRITKWAATIILTSIALLVVQRMALGTEVASGYKDVFRPTLHTFLHNLRNYPDALLSLWDPRFGPLAVLIRVMALLVAVRGVAGRQPLFLTLFACLYAPTLILYPMVPEPRFLIPVFMLFAFYAVRGMERLGSAATVLVSLILLAGYVRQYQFQSFPTIAEANGRSSFVAMCSYVQSNTMPTDRIVFNRARSLSLFTDRPASPYHQPKDPEDLWRYFVDRNIQYVVVSSLFEKDQNVLAPIVEAHKTDLDLKYENPEFRVYRIHR